MNRIFSIKNLFAAALLTGCFAVAGTDSAQACETSRPSSYGYGSSSYQHGGGYWKTVTVWVNVSEPQIEWITKYDCHGRPYDVRVVTERTVRVPVQKRILVSY